MRKILRPFVLLLLLAGAGAATAQVQPRLLPAEQEISLKYGAKSLGKRQDADMKRFRDNRLGAFIHWGLYAIPGGEWNGEMYGGAAEWLKAWAKVPADEWLNSWNNGILRSLIRKLGRRWRKRWA